MKLKRSIQPGHVNTAGVGMNKSSTLWQKTIVILRRKKVIACLVVVLSLLIIGGGAFIYHLNSIKQPVRKTEQVTLRFFSGELPEADNTTHIGQMLRKFTAQTGIKVEQSYPPASVENFTDTGGYVLKSIQPAPSIDVSIVDGTWLGWFSDSLLDLTPYMKNDLNAHYPQMVDAATINGKHIAAPYFQDVPLLYYRKDLLAKYGYTAPPTTWDELESMARRIQDGERVTNPDFWGYLWSGDESESLTTTALEMQSSYGGGTIIDNNKITVNNGATARGIAKLKSWLGTITPMSALRSTEEDSLSLWTTGSAAFMRNWTYAYNVCQEENSEVVDKVGVAVLPAGPVKQVGTLGGEYLGVALRSKHPQEAAKLVQFLTSEYAQKDSTLKDGTIPSITSLYNNKEIQEAIPYHEQLQLALSKYGLQRPGTAAKQHYNDISASYAAAVHKMLAGSVTTSTGLAALERQLMAITGLTRGSP